MSKTSEDHRRVGGICYGWWASALSRETGAGRMARARLRCCVTPVEALAIPETHDMHQILKKGGYDLTYRGDTLALIAITLANVKGNSNDTIATQFGSHPDRNRQRALSYTRFQSLMRTTSPAELIRPLRRALALVDHNAKVAALANDLFYWSEKIRTQWCFHYYGAASATPEKT